VKKFHFSLKFNTNCVQFYIAPRSSAVHRVFGPQCHTALFSYVQMAPQCHTALFTGVQVALECGATLLTDVQMASQCGTALSTNVQMAPQYHCAV
jgi:hypothetical protein